MAAAGWAHAHASLGLVGGRRRRQGMPAVGVGTPRQQGMAAALYAQGSCIKGVCSVAWQQDHPFPPLGPACLVGAVYSHADMEPLTRHRPVLRTMELTNGLRLHILPASGSWSTCWESWDVTAAVGLLLSTSPLLPCRWVLRAGRLPAGGLHAYARGLLVCANDSSTASGGAWHPAFICFWPPTCGWLLTASGLYHCCAASPPVCCWGLPAF
jgi:hypothetical protein